MGVVVAAVAAGDSTPTSSLPTPLYVAASTGNVQRTIALAAEIEAATTPQVIQDVLQYVRDKTNCDAYARLPPSIQACVEMPQAQSQSRTLTPLEAAVANNHTDCAAVLLSLFVVTCSRDNGKLYTLAAANGNTAMLRMFMARGLSLSAFFSAKNALRPLTLPQLALRSTNPSSAAELCFLEHANVNKLPWADRRRARRAGVLQQLEEAHRVDVARKFVFSCGD